MMESQRRLSSMIFFVVWREGGAAGRGGRPGGARRSRPFRRRLFGASARLSWFLIGRTTTLAMAGSLGMAGGTTPAASGLRVSEGGEAWLGVAEDPPRRLDPEEASRGRAAPQTTCISDHDGTLLYAPILARKVEGAQGAGHGAVYHRRPVGSAEAA